MSEDTYLVTAAEIAAMEGLRKTHFLNPNAVRVNKSLGDLAGLTMTPPPNFSGAGPASANRAAGSSTVRHRRLI